jgi:hypothetical protein
MNKHKNKSKKARSGERNRTPISGYARVGNELLPPFAQLERMSPTSWMDDRLPEMLWAALIRVAVSRDQALGEFRRFLDFIFRHPKKELLSDVTLTGISKLDDSLREEVIAFLVAPPATASALATLRLFKTLPARQTWDKLLPAIEPNIHLLMSATGAHLWHQSQEATDCRWLRIMGYFLTDNLHAPKDTAAEWCGYPNEGDQRKVRPSIRASEISFPCAGRQWSQNFWSEAWENTPCMELSAVKETVTSQAVVTTKQISEVLEGLKTHWLRTHSTTAIDAKHDAVFGMAFYALRVLDELLRTGVGMSVLGRLGLRTIFEVHVSLRFLLTKDDQTLWKRWRTFGAGQAKLNSLRFDDTLTAPKYLNVESVERIASEDIWEEFLSINIGSWSGLDLRRLSEQSGLKDIYDKYYSWSSGYVHGTWGPIRESCFVTCGNPLHRLHRYPEGRTLPDAAEDATLLVDNILDDLDRAYSGLTQRLTAQRVAKPSSSPLRTPSNGPVL